MDENGDNYKINPLITKPTRNANGTVVECRIMGCELVGRGTFLFISRDVLI